MRFLGSVVIGLLALASAGAEQHAAAVVTLTIEPAATVERVMPPSVPPLVRPRQSVTGYASFLVATNHDVIAYVGCPEDSLCGPGGRFRHDDRHAPLWWRANFVGLAAGEGLPIDAGTRSIYQVEIQAETGKQWPPARRGLYTGCLTLTLQDR